MREKEEKGGIRDKNGNAFGVLLTPISRFFFCLFLPLFLCAFGLSFFLWLWLYDISLHPPIILDIIPLYGFGHARPVILPPSVRFMFVDVDFLRNQRIFSAPTRVVKWLSPPVTTVNGILASPPIVQHETTYIVSQRDIYTLSHVDILIFVASL